LKNIKINSAKEYVFRSQNTFAWLELKIILKSPDKKWWKQFYKAGSMRQGPALITLCKRAVPFVPKKPIKAISAPHAKPSVAMRRCALFHKQGFALKPRQPWSDKNQQ